MKDGLDGSYWQPEKSTRNASVSRNYDNTGTESGVRKIMSTSHKRGINVVDANQIIPKKYRPTPRKRIQKQQKSKKLWLSRINSGLDGPHWQIEIQ